MSLVAVSRFLIGPPVVILMSLSLAAYVYGGYLAVSLVRHVVGGSSSVATNEVDALQVLDVCLIGTAALVIAGDLLVTFLVSDSGPAGRRDRPQWLGARTVDDLKNRALSMVILIMAVTFLESIVDPGDHHDILDLGVAVGVVLFAIASYLYANKAAATRSPQ